MADLLDAVQHLSGAVDGAIWSLRRFRSMSTAGQAFWKYGRQRGSGLLPPVEIVRRQRKVWGNI